MHERLPIDHPDFRYSSSHNPYWTKLRVERLPVYGDGDTEAHRGAWRTRFPGAKAGSHSKSPPLYVEIGCNAGHVVLEWAVRDPKACYIGVDWKFKMIHKGAEKAGKRGISNLLFLRGHADRLKFMFGPREVDALYLYFPDPWPKKAQRKNRFLNASRLREIHEVLKDDGFFHIKTDHAGYFEDMETAIAETSDLWQVRERTVDLHAGNANAGKLSIPEVTLFEKLFIQDGKPIHSVKLYKK
jgi:tRNA (guanine-N(7)-)-methyltransferase